MFFKYKSGGWTVSINAKKISYIKSREIEDKAQVDIYLAGRGMLPTVLSLEEYEEMKKVLDNVHNEGIQ